MSSLPTLPTRTPETAVPPPLDFKRKALRRVGFKMRTQLQDLSNSLGGGPVVSLQ